MDLLPLLEELWVITFNPNFKDSDINGLVNNLYKAYVNCVKVDSDRIEKSIDALLITAIFSICKFESIFSVSVQHCFYL